MQNTRSKFLIGPAPFVVAIARVAGGRNISTVLSESWLNDTDLETLWRKAAVTMKHRPELPFLYSKSQPQVRLAQLRTDLDLD